MNADLLSAYVDVLRKLAVRRQAEVEGATYAVFAEDLARECVALEDLERVCWLLGRQPRQEFAPAFPDLGTLLSECRRIKHNREMLALSEEAQERERRMLAQPEMSKETAAMWLQRIKRAAHGLPQRD